MLRPRKHMNLESCTLRVSALLLKYLQSERVVSYPELYELVPEETTADKEIVFRSCVNLLFLLGKVNYLPQTDSFEFLEHSNVGEVHEAK